MEQKEAVIPMASGLLTEPALSPQKPSPEPPPETPPQTPPREPSPSPPHRNNPLGSLLSHLGGGDMLLMAVAYMLFDQKADSDLLLALLYIIMG